MSVLLRRSNDIPDASTYQAWLAVSGTKAALDPAAKLDGLAQRLEQAFVAERDTWWRLGRALSAEPTADIARMPTASSFGSDFGIMLAWSRLVDELAGDNDVTLVVCDDPWLFRHLMQFDGVKAAAPPPLLSATIRLQLRGLLSRCRLSFSTALAALRLKGQRRMVAPGDSMILVYGHPDSNVDGNDAYFGDLMKRLPGLKRMLHTDCPAGRATELGTSLHAWGSPLFALGAVFCQWLPSRKQTSGEYGWLIRRAASLENGGGGPAMNRWQAHCQDRWLALAKPSRVAWPWENHGWERNLCRTAGALGVKTIGYQHTVIGPHQFNYATATNPDGLQSIPDIVAADGPAYREQMREWGVPQERLGVGGAFRFRRFADNIFDADGPVFVPLSAIPEAAAAQLNAARIIARQGRPILVKPHPMYGINVVPEANLNLADAPLAEQSRLSAVLYTTGTSGLEAALMGIPAYRLMLEDRIAIDVLPPSIPSYAVTPDTAADAVLRPQSPPARVAWDDILRDPDIDLWKSWLFGDIDAINETPPKDNQNKKTKQAS
ncbi:MAG: hypothetical protein O3A85_10110 [Proteobacteria bacterium]|nr:hypothetical protein [Pseudomonadota bacterium]